MVDFEFEHLVVEYIHIHMDTNISRVVEVVLYLVVEVLVSEFLAVAVVEVWVSEFLVEVWVFVFLVEVVVFVFLVEVVVFVFLEEVVYLFHILFPTIVYQLENNYPYNLHSVLHRLHHLLNRPDNS
jgi:hypothetical protein